MNLAKDQLRRGNVLLTGATGYLGSFVLKSLLEETQVLHRLEKLPNKIIEMLMNFLGHRLLLGSI